MFKFLIILLTINFLNKNININCSNELNNNFNSKKSYNENKNIRKKRATLMDFSPMWDLKIPYSLKRGCGRSVPSILRSIEDNTCLKFERIHGLRNKMIKYVCGRHCRFRKQGENRRIIETARFCRTKARLTQLTLNVLGLIYEERRPDRDKYVVIKINNVDPDERYKFPALKREDVDMNDLRYDFGSIMHNQRFFESLSGKMTIISKNRHYRHTYGQTKEMGFNDIKSLNLLYCYESCTHDLDCDNNGYTDPKDCDVCKCPDFYTGDYCEELMLSQQSCGDTDLIATDKTKKLIISGISTCYYQIVAPKNFKVRITIVDSDLPIFDICPPDVGLEIKFLYDKSVAGPRFCGIRSGVSLTSITNVLTMKYVGLERENFVEIDYIQAKKLIE